MEAILLLEWAPILLDELNITQDDIQGNQEKILEKLDEITNRLEILDAKLDEQTLKGALVGLQHLLDALNSDVDKIKSDNFTLAASEFTKLTKLAPEGTTVGTSGEVENKYLICLGYWGKFHYFNLQGDKRSAAVQVYECTHNYPLIGLILFSARFFSKDYATIISELANKLSTIKSRLDDAEWGNFWKGLWYYTKQSARLITAGAAGFGTAAIAGALSGGAATPAGAVVAKNVLSSLQVEEPKYADSQSLRDEVAILGDQITQLLVELNAECQTRQATLKKYSLKDLIQMGQSNSSKISAD